MKKIIFAACLVLTAISCGEKEEETTVPENTTPKVEAHDMKGLKIAYYHSDSLKKYFEYFKREEEAVTAKQKYFQQEMARRSKEYESFISRNNEKLKGGLLSENEQIKIQQQAQAMEAQIMQYQQSEGSKLEEVTLKKLETISKKIETWGKKFSEENKIDILLINGPGGQINYINPSMDVTKEFTAYLNQHQLEIEKDSK
jgi:Skp family chaperone for outer membrane proteins